MRNPCKHPLPQPSFRFKTESGRAMFLAWCPTCGALCFPRWVGFDKVGESLYALRWRSPKIATKKAKP